MNHICCVCGKEVNMIGSCDLNVSMRAYTANVSWTHFYCCPCFKKMESKIERYIEGLEKELRPHD